jgi:prophage antirepressor-like protein
MKLILHSNVDEPGKAPVQIEVSESEYPPDTPIAIHNWPGFDNVRAVFMLPGSTNFAWWVAEDLCRLLGIVNIKDAVAALDDDEKDIAMIEDPSTGSQKPMLVVSDTALYALVFHSSKPVAKRLRKWLTLNVLFEAETEL